MGGPKKFSDLQREVTEKYQGGEFAHVTSMRVAKFSGDTLFLFALQEAGDAADRDELVSMLRTAVSDLEGLIDGLEGHEPESRAIVPLADRYAREVMDDPAKVVCLEINGVRYVNRGQDIERCLERPDFYSVYARIRDERGDALAHCIGDFASPVAARDYAKHVAKWQDPHWEVHELTKDGWVTVLPEKQGV